MTASDVYASKGGRRYHSHQHCPAFRTGQELWDCADWVPGMSTTFLTGGYGLELIDITEAAERGLARCQRCRPIPTYREPEDFDHRQQWINQGYCGGCPECGNTEEMEICVRCTQQSRRDIPWPCATAVVLGLPTARPA